MATNRPRGSKNTEETPKSKRGRINNVEMLGIGLFFVALLLYGLSKCGSDKPEVNATVTEEVIDSTANNTEEVTNNQNNGSSFSTGEEPAPQPVIQNTTSSSSKLYVIIDSLKMRKGPRLDSALVTFLRYGDEVTDLGQRTALEKIRISVDEVRTAPWVYVQTKEGKKGWAFGAGLQFYPVTTQTNTPERSN